MSTERFGIEPASAPHALLRNQRDVLAQVDAGLPLEQAMESIVAALRDCSRLDAAIFLQDGASRLMLGAASGLGERAASLAPACADSFFASSILDQQHVLRGIADACRMPVVCALPLAAGEGMAGMLVFLDAQASLPAAPDPMAIAFVAQSVMLVLERRRDRAAQAAADLRLSRQAEQLLLASETRLQLALGAGAMGAWEWYPDRAEIRWLHGAPRLHGVDADGGIRMGLEEYMSYVYPEDRAGLAQVMEKVLIEGRHHRTEYRVVWPDKSVHWIEVRGELFFDSEGKPRQMIGISVDVTRSKRAEQDLQFLADASAVLADLVDPQETLERLARLAVPHFADWAAIDMLEADGGLSRVVVAHKDPEKVRLGHELHRRFPPDPAQAQGVWNVLRTGRGEMVSEIDDALIDSMVASPGRRAAMKELGIRSYIGVPLTAHGKTMGAVSFVSAESGRIYRREDLTLAEDLARRAAVAVENARLYRRLCETDQAKDVFLATLAHELRSPLAAIVNGLGMLRMVPGEMQRVEQYTRLMERQAGQLTRLVDELLDMARITTGKIELKKEVVSLASVLNSAIETSRPQIENAQHKLLVSMPGQPSDLLADPVRLAQVFSNLITNAAKYTNPGGQIVVSLECLPEEFIVRVKDNGVGIAPDMLDNVFKIFTQVTHPIRRSQGGLGIGLSLVDGLVRLHGGRVEAFSEGPNRGSEFMVRLPRVMVPPASQQPALMVPAPADRTAGRRILVVDDNIDAAVSIADLLAALGNEVELAHDGLAAVEAAGKMQPDVILLDIGLPGLDGYEAARRIRALKGMRRSLVLIALTGWGNANDRERALDAGFDQHWVKPVGIERLRELSLRG